MNAPVCPECRAGKHRNCDGSALDWASDEIVPCFCRWEECACPAVHDEQPDKVVCLKRKNHNGLHVWRWV